VLLTKLDVTEKEDISWPISRQFWQPAKSALRGRVDAEKLEVTKLHLDFDRKTAGGDWI